MIITSSVCFAEIFVTMIITSSVCFAEIFVTMIITSSVCFAEIIRHCKKIGLLFRLINWQLTLRLFL